MMQTGGKVMKKRFIVMMVMLLSLTLAACQSKTYDIVVTLFPQYDMVRTIVGEKDLTYTMLLAPGVEAHGYEPTSKQIGLIQASKLFIYTSDELETWANDFTNKGAYINLETLTESVHEDAHGVVEEHDHDHEGEHDVHYWVSIHSQVHMVEAVLSLIIELDPENQSYYESNANALIDELRSLRK